MITARNLAYCLPTGRSILQDLDFQLDKGRFLAVLGENGAGKTTLLDILMGFRVRTNGALKVLDGDPGLDPWQLRSRIAYLSEKVDMPGDWRTQDFLAFHSRFYSGYDIKEERELADLFRVPNDARVGNLSAGEIRRLQIVAALAANPDLIIADEITAVLDILGRRRFLTLLKDRKESQGLTVVLATNVPEGLGAYADHILLINRGQQVEYLDAADFVDAEEDLADAVVRRLEQL